jgi:hypothetical protein
LKAQYYPDSDLLVAEVGSSPSQSVERDTHGHRSAEARPDSENRHEGKTNPWNDQWIPRDGLLRLVACLKADPPARVSDFIEPMMAKWKEEKLR